MPQVALEVVDAWNVWQFPFVEMADSRYQKVEMFLLLFTTLKVPCFYSPLRSLWFPVGSQDLSLQPDCRVDVMLLGHALPVIADLWALGVLFAPSRVRGERGLVDVCGDITSDTWIDVFIPGSALYCQFGR